MLKNKNVKIEDKYKFLSDEQREAVLSNNRNVLVTAGPGSGYHYFYVKNKNVSYNIEYIRVMEGKYMRFSPLHD